MNGWMNSIIVYCNHSFYTCIIISFMETLCSVCCDCLVVHKPSGTGYGTSTTDVTQEHPEQVLRKLRKKSFVTSTFGDPSEVGPYGYDEDELRSINDLENDKLLAYADGFDPDDGPVQFVNHNDAAMRVGGAPLPSTMNTTKQNMKVGKGREWKVIDTASR
jgi:hypothetical protein